MTLYMQYKSVECTPSKTRNVLYDVQFIKEKDLLIISGDPGILIYRWSDFQQSILEDQHSQQTVANNIQPICTFHPHPSPMETIEINSTSYDQTNNILYAAAGDGFGCYQWDLETMRLLGTFAGSNVGPRCHSDYLHVVKVIKDRDVITGGEDGKMVGFCFTSSLHWLVTSMMTFGSCYHTKGLLEWQRAKAHSNV